ncbi:homocysteine S-methyltransferase family protein [Eubacteriales bacterium KG127]
MSKFHELLKNKYVFFDGAMGTMLQNSGLKLGERPEKLCFTNPELITDIHRKYIKVGSNVVYTNTFGANRHKLDGTGMNTVDVVKAAVNCARKAGEEEKTTSGKDTLVALDIGPIGELLEPSGTLSFEEAYDIFKEMVVAGEEAGCDLIVFETMTDLYEVKAGVLAAKENTKLPIICTMTFEENGRTFTGCMIESMAEVLTGLDVDALGINCSLGPKEIFPLAEKLARATSKPIVIKANAGLPNPLTDEYDITPEEFAQYMIPYAKLGINIMGGCCGTNPNFIDETIKAVNGIEGKRPEVNLESALCSPSKYVKINGVRVIGERINPTGKKRFQQALKENDLGYVAARAMEQVQAGADILDVNVGVPGIDEAEMMIKVVKLLQSICDLPLQIDSSDPKAIEAGLRAFNGKAIVNSVNGESDVLKKVLPIAKKYGASVLGLTMDKRGIPETAKQRIEIANTILSEALKCGIFKRDIFMDCLTLTVSAQQNQAVETLKAVKYVKDELGLHNVLGVSNISFGLPERINVTTNFLTQAMYCGLDLPIVNPNETAIMDTITSFKVLSGEDEGSVKYIDRFANRKDDSKKTGSSIASDKMDLAYAIDNGLTHESAALTEELLTNKAPMTIINDILIPTLDLVGDKFEKQKIFLPQLIRSAEASCQAFEVLKKNMIKEGAGAVSKGKIIVATVLGDIHDIGKNIVKVMLENYSYQVIDLGRDVPIEKVVETAIKEDVKLIALSALMTTTLSSMKDTIEALHRSGHDCKIAVGGAVLTKEYADEINADFYAKDAKRMVDYAKQVIG